MKKGKLLGYKVFGYAVVGITTIIVALAILNSIGVI